MENDEKKEERIEKAKDTAKAIIKEVEEPKTKKQVMMTATEKVINELNEKIGQAEESGSYFVTITRKEGEKLKHWMGSVKFLKDDKAHSLRELLKQIPTAYKETGKVRRFAPRKHGG